ncbi:MAG: DUF3089 domain-containing protein [Sphingobacteriia bacterium]|jgi:hypothetical protein
MNRIVSIGILVLLISCCFSCSKATYVNTDNFSTELVNQQPDYSDLNNWAAHPFKTDPSDSVPKDLQLEYHPDSTIDVFFIHPTSYVDMNRPFGWNASLNNLSVNQKTDNGTILFQASIFNEVGRVFAPRYRQANLSAYFPKNLQDSTNAMAAFELAYQDIKLAFEYYLSHNNNGRPIIIASHSQGSTHGKRLIKEFFDNSNLKNKLVVAYLVGMPIETDYLKNIKACISPIQTGCICSWRTYKDGYQPPFVEKETFKAIVTNPLTWDSSKPIASRDLNKGGILLKFNKKVEKVTNASINGNVLWSNKPHFFGNIFYTTKNYHVADMNLYYMNIRENAALRAKLFWKQ